MNSSIINENEPDLEEESEEKIDYRIQLREMLDQLREAIHNDLDNQASRPGRKSNLEPISYELNCYYEDDFFNFEGEFQLKLNIFSVNI